MSPLVPPVDGTNGVSRIEARPRQQTKNFHAQMKILPEHLLLRCTQCAAWPMTIVEDEGRKLTFKCIKCRSRETYTVESAGGDGASLGPSTVSRAP
jgi:hypothetical protein